MNRVGEENRGWYVGATLLDFERSNIRASIGLRQTLNDINAMIRDTGVPDRPTVRRPAAIRSELAERAIEADIARLISYRIISMQKRGQLPNYEASMNKLFRSEVSQRIAQTGMKVIGLYGNSARGDKYAALKGRLSLAYLTTVSATIAAGTSEIQRNVVATRGLGLPRG
jgi:alkylation response protein AidB-like acyl-CoA dehydrogenase